jgi:hypothetical protein
MAYFRATHGDKAIYAIMGDFNARLARAYAFTYRKWVVSDDADLETQVTGCWSVHKHDNEMGKKLRDVRYSTN